MSDVQTMIHPTHVDHVKSIDVNAVGGATNTTISNQSKNFKDEECKCIYQTDDGRLLNKQKYPNEIEGGSHIDEEIHRKGCYKCYQCLAQNRTRIRAHCKACIKRIHIPSWLEKPLLWFYRKTSGVITYVLFLIAIYTTILALKPSIALPPQCRKIAVPNSPTSGKNDTQNQLIDPYTGIQYTIGLECQSGEALTIMIFYGFGFLFGEIMELMHLPGLLGMLLGGLLLRNAGSLLVDGQIYHIGKLPNGTMLVDFNGTLMGIETTRVADYPFNVTDLWSQLSALSLVNPALSGILRQLALTTILTRAGLGLDPTALKQVCGSVFRLAFIPCISEAAALMLVTRFLIGWPWAWGAILGFVCAAVSPAVIVPNMMRLEITGWGVAEGIPTLVVAASSLDDVVAITGFGVALAVALSTGSNLVAQLFWGPAEALIGAIFGASIGILLCLFPPPKLEHSHVIRGILLISLAVTGLVGSVGLHLPGAGALACLTLAFVVATGWRNGFPWRLAQFTTDQNLDTALLDSTSTLSKAQSPKPLTLKSMLSSSASPALIDQRPVEQQHTQSPESLQRTNNSSRTGSQRESKNANSAKILEALVEFHPYYCSILRKQYGHHYSGENSHRSSTRSRISSTLHKPTGFGGDLPALAVAVAATGTESKPSTPSVLSPNPSILPKLKASRRFSLPEPTAHYELESFSVGHHMSTSPGPVARLRHLNRSRRRITSSAFAEQCSGMYAQRIHKVDGIAEELVEYPGTNNNETNLQLTKKDDTHVGQNAKLQSSNASLPSATPTERGLACLNSMRRTMAATWWFVQPILFSLIGSEVNVFNMRGESTGRGVGAFLIALVCRLGATILAVLPSKLNMRERVFVAFAWLPKATVQAAVGPVALDNARRLQASAEIIGWGEQVLTVAAISILITAPLGAILMPLTAPYLLKQDISASQVLIEDAPTEQPQSTLSEAHK